MHATPDDCYFPGCTASATTMATIHVPDKPMNVTWLPQRAFCDEHAEHLARSYLVRSMCFRRVDNGGNLGGNLNDAVVGGSEGDLVSKGSAVTNDLVLGDAVPHG